MSTPSYLSDFSDLYAEDPHKASLAWFRQARFGLFMHYGLYSLLGRGEWVQQKEAIPLKEYTGLQQDFSADSFDADFITDLAAEAGMTYVNITSRHHDSFCLFESGVSDYTSTESPASRDIIAELAEQCSSKGLGFFLYYSYSLDWHHPYFYPRTFFKSARPDYSEPEPAYKWEKDEDFEKYIDFVHSQLKELLTGYGPIAGIWFDPIMGFYARPDLFPVQETYALIRSLQPQTLISFKQGANGEEDFAAPERKGASKADDVMDLFGPYNARVAEEAWEKNKDKYNEICDTLQPGIWGYRKEDDSSHRTSREVMDMLEQARAANCNLLLNTGPLPDGSIHPEDVKTLRETGKLLRRNA